MVLIFQVASAAEKPQEQNLHLFDQLFSNPKNVSIKKYSPADGGIRQEIKSQEDALRNFGKLSKDGQATFLTEIVLAANNQFGKQKAKEILTPFFQQLGLSSQVLDAILKAVEKTKKDNADISFIVQQVQQNLIQDDYQKKKGEADAQLKELVAEKVEKEGIEHQP